MSKEIMGLSTSPKKKSAALARYEEVCAIIKGEEVALSLLDKLLESGEAYFVSVTTMERKMKSIRFRYEGEDLRERITSLDLNRKIAHDALLSNLHIFNRYFIKEFDAPVGGVYSEDPESIRDRVAVADWLGHLLTALYEARKR